MLNSCTHAGPSHWTIWKRTVRPSSSLFSMQKILQLLTLAAWLRERRGEKKSPYKIFPSSLDPGPIAIYVKAFRGSSSAAPSPSLKNYPERAPCHTTMRGDEERIEEEPERTVKGVKGQWGKWTYVHFVLGQERWQKRSGAFPIRKKMSSLYWMITGEERARRRGPWGEYIFELSPTPWQNPPPVRCHQKAAIKLLTPLHLYRAARGGL